MAGSWCTFHAARLCPTMCHRNIHPSLAHALWLAAAAFSVAPSVRLALMLDAPTEACEQRDAVCTSDGPGRAPAGLCYFDSGSRWAPASSPCSKWPRPAACPLLGPRTPRARVPPSLPLPHVPEHAFLNRSFSDLLARSLRPSLTPPHPHTSSSTLTTAGLPPPLPHSLTPSLTHSLTRSFRLVLCAPTACVQLLRTKTATAA